LQFYYIETPVYYDKKSNLGFFRISLDLFLNYESIKKSPTCIEHHASSSIYLPTKMTIMMMLLECSGLRSEFGGFCVLTNTVEITVICIHECFDFEHRTVVQNPLVVSNWCWCFTKLFPTMVNISGEMIDIAMVSFISAHHSHDIADGCIFG
jgi:hypothetical protein